MEPLGIKNQGILDFWEESRMTKIINFCLQNQLSVLNTFYNHKEQDMVEMEERKTRL